MGVDQIAAGLGRSQHGALARRQLLPRGVTDHAIQHRVAKGTWEQPVPGVYVIAGSPSTPAQRLMVACLAGRGVASHRGAAFLLSLEASPVVEITTPHAARVPGATVYRYRLERVDTCAKDGIPCTTVPRTLIDLAGVIAPDRWEDVLDDALSRKLTTRRQLQGRLADLGRRGRRGVGLVRKALEERAGERRPLNSFERRISRLLRGFTEPCRQYLVTTPDGRRRSLDFAWPDWKIGFEGNGHGSHSGRRNWNDDQVRTAELEALGWIIVPATPEMVRDQPDLVLRALDGAFGRSAQGTSRTRPKAWRLSM